MKKVFENEKMVIFGLERDITLEYNKEDEQVLVRTYDSCVEHTERVLSEHRKLVMKDVLSGSSFLF